MTLKALIEHDLGEGIVWFNEDEFADWHEVNGARVLCEVGAIRDAPQRIGRLMGGVVRDTSYLFIRASDFASKPAADQPIRIDGKQYRIASVMDDIGCYVIEFGRYDDAEIRRKLP